MNKPILYVLCGPPGSGKSYFHNYHFNSDIRVVSRDVIRFNLVGEDEEYFSKEKEVFERFVQTIAIELQHGRNVVADATHINKASRAKLISNIDNIVTYYDIIYIVMITPLDVCQARNRKRYGRARVPDDVISKSYNNFRTPSPDEDHRIIGIWRIYDYGRDICNF